MTINSRMILNRIKANLDILKDINKKISIYKKKLEIINGLLTQNPNKNKIKKSFIKARRYASIFLAIIHEDIFFLLDCNTISIPQYKKINLLLQSGLIHKEEYFYKKLQNIIHK